MSKQVKTRLRRKCKNCHEVYSVSREWQLFCSTTCRQQWNYKEAGYCFYCGEPGTTEKDHIFPVCNRPGNIRASSRQEVVNACLECNDLLGGREFPYVEERLQFLIEQYNEKYNLVSGVPEWNDEEIEELGPNLRHFIKSKLIKRHKAERRVVYIKAMIAELKKGRVHKPIYVPDKDAEDMGL